MLKWVVTRGPGGVAPRVPPFVEQKDCSCNKENHCEEFIEIESNISYAFNDLGNHFTPRKCRLSSGPLKRSASYGCMCSQQSPAAHASFELNSSPKRQSLTPKLDSHTPLTSRNLTEGRTRKLRTRRERNKTLCTRLSAASMGNLSEIGTPANVASMVVDPVSDLLQLYRDPSSADLLQNFFNSNQTFNEREIKTPEGTSPLECGTLLRQRAVRRKQGKTASSIHQLQLDPNDNSTSFFNCFVFRELAQEMLV